MNSVDEKKPEPVEQQAALEVRIDIKLVRALWPYLNSEEPIPSDIELKTKKGPAIVKMLQEQLIETLKKNEDKLSLLQKEFSPEKLLANAEPFKLSDISKQGLEILEDIPIDYDDWIETAVDD